MPSASGPLLLPQAGLRRQWVESVLVASGRSAQEAELDQRPDRQAKARQLKHDIYAGVRADVADHARQEIEHQQPPAALVAVVQTLDGDGDARNDDGNDRDRKNQDDAQQIRGEGKKQAEEEIQREQRDEIDEERKPVFRAIDASAKA